MDGRRLPTSQDAFCLMVGGHYHFCIPCKPHLDTSSLMLAALMKERWNLESGS